MSMPPAAEAMNTGLPCTRSSTMPRYSSRSMGRVSSISRRCTTRPSGPVWCVISVIPMILRASSDLNAVEHDAEVQFALDGQGFFDQQALHDAPFGDGLVRHQHHPHDLSRQFERLDGVLRHLDAAALAAQDHGDD